MCILIFGKWQRFCSSTPCRATDSGANLYQGEESRFDLRISVVHCNLEQPSTLAKPYLLRAEACSFYNRRNQEGP